jgi:uncharacterized protein YeaO (DUF488 family)
MRRPANRLEIKRIYAHPRTSDGTRILVDRLWPRGVTKEQAAVHVWMKEIAPSPSLRTRFGHEPGRWIEFRKQYVAELKANQVGVLKLANFAAAGSITLLYAARDEAHNHALVLVGYMRKRRARTPTAKG